MSSYEQNDGIRLIDIIKLFWKKVIWIALALCIGVASGATFGFVKNTRNKVYGTQLSFFINTKKDGQINQQIYGVYGSTPVAEMIGQLSKDHFFEYLFLDDNGLPAKGINAEIDAKIAVAEPVVLATKALTEEKETKLLAVLDMVKEWEQDPSHTAVGKDENELPKKNIDATIDEKVAEVRALIKEEMQAVENAQALAQAAIEEWQKTADYAKYIPATKQAVTYSREVSEEDKTVATSFIYVDIKIKNNEEFAKILREKIVDRLPKYVEDNMYVPDDFDGTNCSRMSRMDEIVCLTDQSMFSTIVKNGVLFGFATTAIACVVILILNIGTLTKKEEEQAQTADKE